MVFWWCLKLASLLANYTITQHREKTTTLHSVLEHRLPVEVPLGSAFIIIINQRSSCLTATGVTIIAFRCVWTLELR